ncbi:MAG: T9SS type A sorting domain-containing protein, partial [Bacteroidetes bacterium]|nr:T9SS type A sorting domain-containing protein [Bacteroidota bacterium]
TSNASVCAGQSVTFTAATTNAGNAPTYQWMVNNINAGTNSATFTTSTLNNNDVVTCTLTSNAACVTNATANSNALLMTVIPSTVPSVSIATATSTICNGSSASFTATATNGGASPAYQWKVNGNNVGSNSATFASSTLNNGDVVTVALTSNATCPLPATVTSNAITMTVTGSVVPSVTINASATSICAGASATFTAVPVNGGTTPTYQWKVNGLNVGTGNTYTSSSLNNNDTVRVVMTSSSGCALPTTGTSAGTVITVNPNVAPTVTIAGSSNICAGASVTYTATVTNAGTTPSYQWKLNGNNVGGNSATYITSALANNDTLYCVVTSSSSCATPNTATSNKIGVTVSPNVTPSLSIATTNTSVCSGTTVVFTATATNGGTTPAYQWKVNGSNVGTNSASYSSSTLNNSDVVTCVLTSNAACAAPLTATSNAITMLVTPVAAPTITISTATTTICSGANTTFTAAITNGGANAAYQWKVNGNNVGNNSATFSTTTLANNDVVTCQLTSSALCASPLVVTSNAIAVSVGTNATPTVSISANTTTVCAGTAVNFTATITGGGSTPAYQWKVNGGNVGTNSPTFSSTTLANNAVVTCVLTSSSACATPASVTSNALTITVNTVVAPTLSIAASSTTVCSGTAVTFTATATNAGTTPTYQWKLNGNNVGSNQATYSLAAPVNNDVVSVVLTSSAACATPASITSNTVTLSVSQSVTPSVAITASSTNVCGGPITFTATAANEGTTPIYQWKVNGNNAGTNNASFTTGTLTNGDVVSVVLTSSAACATSATATSNSITVTGSAATPVVSIAANNSNICQGTAVTFTATVTNPGTSQAYQWKVNGVNAGSNSNAFTVNTLTANDTVSCTVTVTSACAGTLVVSSNKLSIQILPSVNASVAIAASQNNICQGVAVTLTATATNGGNTPAYQWKVNGVNTGTNSSQFISSTLNNNDTVTCVLTSSATCALPAAATSNAIIMIVQPSVAPTVSISPSAVTACQGSSISFTANNTNAGANPAYQWKVNGNNVGGNTATFSANNLANGDVVTCELTGSAACSQPATATSNAVTVNITAPVTPTVSITANTTSICNGNTITFTAASTHGGTAPVYTWMVNGNTVGGSSNTFSSTTLANGDVVSAQLTSNATCVTSATALSNTITVNVTAPVTPTVSIVSSDTTICTGTAVTFTAVATNGGSTPSYLWMVNSNTAGTNSNTFTSSTLNNGDVVKCILTSSASCATTQVATSSTITIVVSSSLQPTVAVAASADSACIGTALTYAATTNNAGSNAQYDWLVNNNSTGITTATFTSSTLANGDVVVCRVTSSASCSNGAVVSSQPITVHIMSSIVPTVTVSASDTSICAGQNVVFTAAATNGGNAPIYQWLVNGNNVGGNAATYASATLANSDVVTVSLTSSESCATVATVASAPLTIVVEASVVSSVSVSALPNDTICEGTNVTLTAQAVNGGNSPVYTWKVNGTTEGTNSATYTSSSLSNGDVVTVELASNANCVAQTTVSSTPIAFTVNATPAIPTISQSGNVLTSSAPAGNQWHAAWQPISGATEQNYTINSNGWYSVVVTDANGCTSTSDSVQVVYSSIADIDWNSAISIAPNPFMEQFKVNLSAEVLTNGEWNLTVTDMLGRLIYEKAIRQPQMIVDFTHRAAGTYNVSISNGNTLRTYKVVKQ